MMTVQSKSFILAAKAAMMALAFAGWGFAAQAQVSGDFSALAKRVTPAVVNISSTHRVDVNDGPTAPFDFPPGSPFEEFFENLPQNPEQRERLATSLGSGFIIDPSGYVVTNTHVIEGATEIEVALSDGRTVPAKLIGTDARTDIALLKIDGVQNLPAVTWGDSNRIEVGQWVMAVGNPFGLGGSVTAGIVSARGRDIGAGPFDDFLQIDAAINRGNSGGPTFNLQGEVIGINTAIASPNGGSVGIGFAIPSNLARPIVDQLRIKGRVERGWLGVQIQEVTPEIATALSLDRARGALVSDVQPDSPALRAGLRQGDVILSVNDQIVQQMRDLPRIVAGVKAGTQAMLGVWRDGRERQVTVQIGELRDEQVAANTPESDNPPTEGGTQTLSPMGLTIATLNDEWRGRFNIPAESSGVIVTDVNIDGPAAKQGVRPGDIILKIGQADVASPQDIQREIDTASKRKDEAILFLLSREGNQRYVALPLQS